MAGTLVLDTLRNGAGTASTSADNVINGSAKAWVNYKGTATRGINGSYNVSSVTYNGQGDYTINFTNAMTNANYASNVSISGFYGVSYFLMGTIAVDASNNVLKTSSSVRIFTGNYAGATYDVVDINVAIFR